MFERRENKQLQCFQNAQSYFRILEIAPMFFEDLGILGQALFLLFHAPYAGNTNIV